MDQLNRSPHISYNRSQMRKDKLSYRDKSVKEEEPESANRPAKLKLESLVPENMDSLKPFVLVDDKLDKAAESSPGNRDAVKKAVRSAIDPKKNANRLRATRSGVHSGTSKKAKAARNKLGSDVAVA